MTNILLSCVLGLMLAGMVAGYVFYRRARRSYEAAKAVIFDYVTPNAGQPSKLSVALDLYGQMLARSLVIQIKTTLMGERSAEVRAGNAEADASNQDKLAQLGLPGILAASGGMRRTLRKNPGLLDLALPFLQTMMSGSHGNGSHSTDSADRPRFKLG